MIYVLAKFTVKLEKREEFIAIAKEMAEKTRVEDGCIQYVFASPADKPENITVIETWRDAPALDVHAKSRHFEELIPKLSALCSAEAEINRYSDVHA